MAYLLESLKGNLFPKRAVISTSQKPQTNESSDKDTLEESKAGTVQQKEEKIMHEVIDESKEKHEIADEILENEDDTNKKKAEEELKFL